MNAHSGELGSSTARDLLDADLVQLSLELLELLREVILALSPELTGLDLGRRLENERKISVSISLPCFFSGDSDSEGQKRTMVGGFESGREGCRLDD